MKKKYSIRHIIAGIIKYFSLFVGAFACVYPVITCVIVAFKTQEEYEQTSKISLPASWLYLDNFKTAWVKGGLGKAFLTSTLVLVVVVTASVLLGAMLAYILSRFKFPGNGLIKNLFLFASLLPGIAMQVTVYKLMMQLKLVNTLYGYMILLMGTDIIGIYIFIQFFENIPVSLDESAIMDGAGYFTVFFKILFPLLRPAVITVMILKGVGVWNEYYAANLYLNDYSTISKALYTFTGPFGNQYNLICAGVFITMIPVLVVFILCQKQIYNGLTQGAVKE